VTLPIEDDVMAEVLLLIYSRPTRAGALQLT
jgi:hypothetical protein